MDNEELNENLENEELTEQAQNQAEERLCADAAESLSVDTVVQHLCL